MRSTHWVSGVLGAPAVLGLLVVLSFVAIASIGPKGSLDEIFVSSFENRRPVADAGPNRVAQISQFVTLSGSGTDPDGDLVSSEWSVISQPVGSNVGLVNATTLTPSFTPTHEGSYVVRLRVTDDGQLSATDTVTVIVTVEPPQLLADAGPDQVVPRGTAVLLDGRESAEPQGLPLAFAWSIDVQPEGSIAVLQNASSATSGFTPAAAGLYRIRLIVSNGSQFSAPSTVEVSVFPPSPSASAPPLPATEVTSTPDATAFLYSGNDPIQTNVSPGAISAQRGAVVRGRVIDRSSAPIPGVTVQVLNRPEFGRTVSQVDGQFDLAVNGGEQIVLEYSRDGLLPIQRRVDVAWQGQREIDRVVMIPPDPIGKSLALDRATLPALVVASTSQDRDGRRRASLYVPRTTAAQFVLSDGSRRSMGGSATLRITEYTVGDLGPNTMPGELPWTTSYTYAADISIDEPAPSGATRLIFGEPLSFYVDNFLDFPAGEVVPLGYYDRNRAEWVPAPNGRVIRVLAINNGVVDLDVSGSGQPATPAELAALGITVDELSQIATLYSTGQSFWRSKIPFLQVRGAGRISQPWDCNWPRVLPAGARPPQLAPVQVAPATPQAQPGAASGTPAPGEATCRPGSVIQCQRQVMMKSLSIVGAPFALHYSTERTPGWRANNSVVIPISGSTVPANILEIALELRVAGSVLNETFGLTPNQSYLFSWDGRDAWGRLLNGAQEVKARVGYTYPAIYAQPAEFQASFSTLSGIPLSTNRARESITLWQEHLFQLGAPTVTAVFGIGGFSLTPHHFYDPGRRTLFQGDGQIRDPAAQPSDYNVRTSAGGSIGGFGGDGGPATDALLSGPRGLAVGGEGSIYVADTLNHRVRRIDPSGSITTVAGTGVVGSSGDGGLATLALLSAPTDVAVDRDGTLYIADSHNHRVRRVRRDGIIETAIGIGTEGYSGDGALATSAQLAYPNGVAIGPFGELYVADTFNHRVRRVGFDGVITTTAGQGTPGDAGDGGPAIQAALQFPVDLDVSAEGEQFIVDNVNHKIRRVDIGGVIYTAVGTGQQGTATGVNGDGGPATAARLNFPRSVSILADGGLLIADGSSRRVRAVTTDGVIVPLIGGGQDTVEGTPGRAFQLQFPSGAVALPNGRIVVADTGRNRVYTAARFFPQFSVGEVVIASPDGAEVHRFAATGRHLDTRDTFTGAVRWQFAYDTAGRLSSLTDGGGNTTQVQRDAAGTPTAIVSPDGLATELVLTNGLLTEVRNPNAERVRMEYGTGGLMTRYVDARNFASTYTYDPTGRLLASSDPAGGGQTLSRAESTAGATVTVQSAMGRTTSYVISTAVDGTQSRRTNFPDGTHTEVLVAPDGAHTTMQPDGTLADDRAAPDPRFGLEAGYTASSQTSTGSQTMAVSTSRSVTLANPKDPLSISGYIEQRTVNGRQGRQSYDAATRTWTTTSPAGRVSTTVVDAQGRPLRTSVPGLADVEMLYDPRGRLSSTRSGVGPDARIATYSYDSRGFLSSVTDPLGRTVAYARDSAGRPTVVQRPDGLTTQFAYDGNGNLASLTPAGRPAHGFAHTPVNLVATYQPPPVNGSGATNTIYNYNPDRQLIEAVRPDGENISYTYDSAGRLSAQTINRGSYMMSYSATSGKLTGLNAPGGINLAYTFSGALPTQALWSGPLAGRVNYTYDTDFRVNSISVNGANAISMAYDADSLLSTVGSLTLSYNAQNGLLQGSSIGTISDTYTHNAFAEPLSYTVTQAGSALYGEVYTRDKLGRITRKVETVGGTTRTLDYVYDVMGRLTEVKTDDVVTSRYTYDSNGNRLSRVVGPQTTNYAYDDQDRMLTAGAVSFGYTAASELRTITNGSSVTTLNHDELGNLLSVALPDGRTISYGIDGQNRRVRKLVNGTAVQGFLYQDQYRITAELDGANAIISRFVYGNKPHVPVYMIRDGQIFRIITDQIGSVRLAINATTGTIAQRIDYDEFGRVVADTAPGFQPFGAAGGLWDRDTGLVRLGARDYDPTTGRWTSRDPVLFSAGDDNLFRYAGGDPINRIDTTGLAAVLAVNRTSITNGHSHMSVPGGHAAASIGGQVMAYSTVTGAQHVAYTLEEAYPHNRNLPVPPGVYPATLRTDYTPNRIELHGVKGATNVQFHIGNTTADVIGCFAVGSSTSENRVGGSKAALTEINSIIAGDGTGVIWVIVDGGGHR